MAVDKRRRVVEKIAGRDLFARQSRRDYLPL